MRTCTHPGAAIKHTFYSLVVCTSCSVVAVKCLARLRKTPKHRTGTFLRLHEPCHSPTANLHNVKCTCCRSPCFDCEWCICACLEPWLQLPPRLQKVPRSCTQVMLFMRQLLSHSLTEPCTLATPSPQRQAVQLFSLLLCTYEPVRSLAQMLSPTAVKVCSLQAIAA